MSTNGRVHEELNGVQATPRADRLVPHNIEAERSVLGCLMIGELKMSDVIDILCVTDFWRDAHQVAWRAMLDLYEVGKAIDAVSLWEELKRDGNYESVGKYDFLTDLVAEARECRNPIEHVMIVREHGIRRQLAEQHTDGLDDIYSQKYTAAELVARHANRIAAIEHASASDPDDDESSFVPMPTAMEPDAFRGVAGEIVRIIEPHSEACPEGILAQLIVASGSRLGRRPYWVHDASRHYCNLFACLVGPTGVGKGIAWKICQWLLQRADNGWNPKAVISGLTSGEGLIKVAMQADGPLLCVEPEFGRTLSNMRREKSNLSHVLRDAFDGGDLRVPKSTEPLYAEDAYISILAHVTAADLAAGMAQTDKENGFANRFAYVSVYRARDLPDGGDLDSVEQALAPLIGKVTRALDQAARHPAFDRAVARDEKARTLWHEVYPSLRNRPHGDHGKVTMRAAPIVMRLAVIYAVLDGRHQVSVTHLRSALAFWRYCDQTAASLFGDPRTDEKLTRLLELLDESQAGVSRTTIRAKIGHGRLNPSQIDTLLQSAFSTGRYLYKEVTTGGRKKRIILAKKYVKEKGN
jgi:DnaB-like helicase N terminal domain/Protein of unknown function (DUF3987)